MHGALDTAAIVRSRGYRAGLLSVVDRWQSLAMALFPMDHLNKNIHIGILILDNARQG